MPSSDPNRVDLSTSDRLSDLRRRRVSIYAVLLGFLFVFSGLFAGFIVAHIFPDTVLSLVYGVRTDAKDVVKPPVETVPEQDVAEPAPAAPPDQAAEAAVASPVLPPSFEPGVIDAATRKPAPPAPPSEPARAETAPAVQAPASFVTLRQKPAAPTALQQATYTPGPQGSQTIAAADQQALSVWSMGKVPGGFLERAILVSTGQVLAPGQTLAPDSVIDVVGWTGDVYLGMRFEDVLVAVCDKVVARGRVNIERPDVAQSVHPNLLLSGWTVRLFVGHLPRCPEPKLEAFGVTPGSAMIFRLNNTVALALPQAEPAPGGVAPFTPRNVRPLRMYQVEIAEATELRRCGRADCEPVGLALAGASRVSMENEQGDWVLVIFAEKAGWMPRAKLKRLP